jgi:hypothetical protein
MAYREFAKDKECTGMARKSYRNFTLSLETSTADVLERFINETRERSVNAYLRTLVSSDLERRGYAPGDDQEAIPQRRPWQRRP